MEDKLWNQFTRLKLKLGGFESCRPPVDNIKIDTKSLNLNSANSFVKMNFIKIKKHFFKGVNRLDLTPIFFCLLPNQTIAFLMRVNLVKRLHVSSAHAQHLGSWAVQNG